MATRLLTSSHLATVVCTTGALDVEYIAFSSRERLVGTNLLFPNVSNYSPNIQSSDSRRREGMRERWKYCRLLWAQELSKE